MAERSGAAKAPAGQDGPAPVADRPEAVRNVVLVGPSGSGKTTLLEHLLLATGSVTRPGHRRGRHHRQRPRRGRGAPAALGRASRWRPVVVDGVKVNLLDTPGYADYVGELRAGLRAADCALFVVSAAEPLDGAARTAWQECEAVGMPRAVVITKLDHPRADYTGTLAAVRAAFGETAVPLYLPLGSVGRRTAPGARRPAVAAGLRLRRLGRDPCPARARRRRRRGAC